jgi:hypothetical protein
MFRYKLRTLLILLAILPPLLWFGWTKYEAWRAEKERQRLLRTIGEALAAMDNAATWQVIRALARGRPAAASGRFRVGHYQRATEGNRRRSQLGTPPHVPFLYPRRAVADGGGGVDGRVVGLTVGWWRDHRALDRVEGWWNEHVIRHHESNPNDFKRLLTWDRPPR